MTSPRPLSILLAGGGTAGHVSPLLATAEAIRALEPSAVIHVLGTQEGLESRLVPEAGLPLLTIEKVPFPRSVNRAALAFPGRFAGTIRRAASFMRDHRVDVVAGFGGYVCPPAYLAARTTRTPIVVHEANRRPGMANKLGARSAAAVLTAFEDTPLPHAERVGMPMREAIATLDRAARREEAIRGFGLDPSRPVLLVTGGSLGAQRLNATIVEALPDLKQAGIQVLHITGRGKSIREDSAGYRAVEYVSAMEEAYAAADFAVTRSGAGTVCEVSAVGLPALFVPLPIGNGEQSLNGEPVVEAGGALMVPDAEFTADVVRTQVIPVMADPARRAQMSACAAAHGIRDAAQRTAAIVIGAARGA